MKHIKTVRAGKLVKQIIYTVADAQQCPRERAERRKATTAAQARLNLHNSTERLEMLLAANFSPSDFFLTLTLNDEHLPKSEKESDNRKKLRQIVRAYFKRLRPFYKAAGKELKYVYSPQGLTSGRYHIHMAINAPYEDVNKSLELLRSLWNEGFSEVKYFSSYYEKEGRYIDFGRVAGYMTREAKEEGSPCGVQVWTRSRNLKNPIIEKVERVTESATINTPAGAYQLIKEEQCSPYGSYTYLKYVYPIDTETLPKKPITY